MWCAGVCVCVCVCMCVCVHVCVHVCTRVWGVCFRIITFQVQTAVTYECGGVEYDGAEVHVSLITNCSVISLFILHRLRLVSSVLCHHMCFM